MKYYQKRQFKLDDINRGEITLNYFQKEALDKRFPYHLEWEGDVLRHEQTLALDEALYRDYAEDGGDGQYHYHFVYDEDEQKLNLLCKW